MYHIYAIQKGQTVAKSFAFTKAQAQRIAKEKKDAFKDDIPTTIVISKN